jgi:Sigma-70 region 2
LHPQCPALPSVYIEERRKILVLERVMSEQDRLRSFIRRRVPDRRDVEDVLQDVFVELVEAYRLMKPVEEVGACGGLVPSLGRLVS